MAIHNDKLIRLTECSVMLALSIVLSFIKVWEMPMGGSVTLLSMLPVLLLSVKDGAKGAVPTAFVFALFQLLSGVAAGNVFVYCTNLFTVVICALFDYIVPFTVLGFGGVFGRLCGKENEKKAYAAFLAGFAAVMAVRFLCHFITGVTVWSQWAPEGQSKYVYSLLYNGQFMLPECVFTTAGAAALLKLPAVKKLLGLR